MKKRFTLTIVLTLVALSGFSKFQSGKAKVPLDSPAPHNLPRTDSGVPQDRVAEEVYRNIQVFKGIPASQLLGAMNFMAGALGVSCNYCHVANQFTKDDKLPKQVARRHILMTRAANDTAFDGHSIVNCVTCHRGQSRPTSFLKIRQSSVLTSPTGPLTSPNSLPTVENILARYIQALGGRSRLEKLKSISMYGKRVMQMGSEPTSDELLEVYRKAPNKLLMRFKSSSNLSTQAFNGTQAWRKNNNRVSAITGPELIGAQRDAQFLRDTQLSNEYDRMFVVGMEEIEGKNCYVIEGTLPEKNPAKMMFGVQIEKLYFDEKSGLLIRRLMEYKTVLGQLPEATDYGDYRKVNGLMFPFTIRLSRAPLTAIQKIEVIKLNASIGDDVFEMPSGN